MARQGNNVTLTAGSGAASTLQKPIAFDDGRKCRRIRLRVALSLTNSSTLVQATTAFLLQAFQSIIGNLSIQFGDASADVVDGQMPFNQLRELYAFMEGRDVTVNGIGLQAVSGNVPIAASTTTIVQLEAVRSFQLTRAAQDITDWCPGASQMKQMLLTIQPGTGATPVLSTVTFTSPVVQVQVILDDMPSEGGNDVWASVPRCRIMATSGTSLNLPIGNGGAIFAIWDEAFVAASNPLSIFDVKADGRLINGAIGYGQYLQGYSDEVPFGSFDPQVLISPYYTSPQVIDPNLMETAESLVWDQPNNEVVSPKVLVGFIPAITSDYAQMIGNNVNARPNGAGATFMLANLHSVANTNNPPSAAPAASTTPVAIVAPTDTSFSTISGTVFRPGQLPSVEVPTATTAKVAASVKSAGGTGAPGGSSALAKAAKSIALSVPGLNSPNKSPINGTANLSALTGKLLAGVNALHGNSPQDNAAAVSTKIISPSR